MKRANNTSLRSEQYLLVVQPQKIAIRFFYIAVFLLIINLICIFFYQFLGYSNVVINTLVQLFYATGEYNIPALFSTLLLFLSAVFLYAIYRLPDRHIQKIKKQWLILSFIFLFLSVDEVLSIHERLNKIKDYIGIDISGYIISTWLIPYSFFVLICGLFFIRFLRHLPVRTKKLFVISGGIYICATIVFELFESRMKVVLGGVNTLYFLLCAVEEFLEMTGIIIFLYALLDYISLFNPSVQIMQKETRSRVQRPEAKTLAEADFHN